VSDKLKTEILRKLVHIFSLAIIVLYYHYNVSKEFMLNFLLVCLVIELILEYLRLDRNVEFPFFKDITRESEKDKIGAEIYFTLGAIIAISTFEKNIALASITVATIGDMTAALVGTKFGTHKIYQKKSWEGSIAELVINLVICFFFTKNILLSFSMASVATFIETISDKINDNLTIPVFAGSVGHLITQLVLKK